MPRDDHPPLPDWSGEPNDVVLVRRDRAVTEAEAKRAVAAMRDAADAVLFGDGKASSRRRESQPMPPSVRAPVGAKPEYVNTAEVCRRLACSSRTARRRRHNGTWVKGYHWTQPAGSRPLFDWLRLDEWRKCATIEPPESDDVGAAYGADIPRGRRYARRAKRR